MGNVRVAGITAKTLANPTLTRSSVDVALRMSMVLVSITLAMALGRRSIVTALRSSARYINRVSGAILVLAGAYIVWFWGTNIGEGAGALSDQGAFRFVENLSQRAVALFGQHPALWGLALGGIVVTAVIYLLLNSEPGDDTPSRRPDPIEAPTGAGE